jgi:glutaredoxin 3
VSEITLYTVAWCGYCVRARRLLEARGVEFLEVPLDDDPAFRQKVFDLGARWTVPLVMIDDTSVGGYDELVALDRRGVLAPLAA